jgi:transposase-like protein
MEDASMTSENVAEHEAGESATAVSAKAVDDQLIDELVSRAQAEGLRLTGEGGLLQQLTKRLLESALEGEISDHLGYDKHDPAGKDGGNSRNGKRSKTVLTDVGPVEIAVPRDRDGSFEPKIVKKRQKRLTGVDEMVISLAAKSLTTGEVQAHLAEVYGAEVSRQTISTITDKVLEGMAEWQSRPLDSVYPVVLVDAIHVKIRDGAVANRPIYVALAVTTEGRREILGLWAGDGGEGAKHWLHILTEIKNRGVSDVLMLVCDGLKGLPEAVETVWPRTIVQTCVVHRSRKESTHCFHRTRSLLWYELRRRRSGSARAAVPGRLAASERASTTSDAGPGGATARTRWGTGRGAGGRGEREHGP